MSSIKPSSSTPICHFVAELVQRTIDTTDEVAYQRALQAFVDEQKPWMPPTIGPPRKHAPLFSSLELDEDSGQVSASFTPEGLACFQGWLLRRGLEPMMECVAQNDNTTLH